MNYFEGLSVAENYAQNSSKKHNSTRYVTKGYLLNIGIVYYVYESDKGISRMEKIISTFKDGERI